MSQPNVGQPDPTASVREPIAEDVGLVWPDDIGDRPEIVNQVIVSFDQTIPDLVYLYLGHVAPPPWLSPEQAQERLIEMGNRLTVVPRGSFVLSRQRAEELWDALGRHLGKLPPQ